MISLGTCFEMERRNDVENSDVRGRTSDGECLHVCVRAWRGDDACVCHGYVYIEKYM